MATRRWETTFDLIGFAAYYLLVSGELPDDELMATARTGTHLQLVEPAKQTARRPKKRKAEVAAA